MFEVSIEISFVMKVIYSYKKSSQIDFEINYFHSAVSTGQPQLSPTKSKR